MVNFNLGWFVTQKDKRLTSLMLQRFSHARNAAWLSALEMSVIKFQTHSEWNTQEDNLKLFCYGDSLTKLQRIRHHSALFHSIRWVLLRSSHHHDGFDSPTRLLLNFSIPCSNLAGRAILPKVSALISVTKWWN